MLPSTKLETLVTADLELANDPVFMKAAAPFWDAPGGAPPYSNIESTLLRAFEGYPKLVVPAAATKKEKRIYHLRQYESPTTMDHIREFGTLKAMGAPNSYVYKVIMQQAAISAVMGYVLGMIVSVIVVRSSQEGGAAILMPMPMAVGMFFLTLAMCIAAALVSINQVTRIDPAMVFKG